MELPHAFNPDFGSLYETGYGEFRWTCNDPECFGEFHSREGTLIRDHVYRHQHPGEEPPPEENPPPEQSPTNESSTPEENLSNETSSDEDDNEDGSERPDSLLRPARRPYTLSSKYGTRGRDKKGEARWTCVYCGMTRTVIKPAIQRHLKGIHKVFTTIRKPASRQ